MEPESVSKLATPRIPVAEPRRKEEESRETSGKISSSDYQGLDEMKIFRAVLGALLLTILLCIVIHWNFLLLGEFFFIYFLAFVTSVSLRAVKHSIVDWLEKALKKPGQLIQNTHVYRINEAMIDALRNHSLSQLFTDVSTYVTRRMERRQ